MSNPEIEAAEARLASLRQQYGEDKPANPLFDSANSLFHGIVNLLPWRQESDKKAAHDAVNEHVPTPEDEPQGRNTVPAGVVEPTETPKTDNQGDANSFPGSNPQE